ncbi:MAG: alpha/beta hydrolase [Deltaproteobacteria bacterium]|nr:alpha/beta hydrolase [Deltaproteobacteria bacterium]
MEMPSLYYEVHGDSGPCLLLVHGLLSSRAQWLPNLEALTEFCRPVVVELFGHGRSPSPETPESYTPENYTIEFDRIRDEIGAERWFVCGQSLGATLTLLYSIMYPESVFAQAFTNSRSALSDMTHDTYTRSIPELIEKEGRKVIETFPYNPARNRRLTVHIRNSILEDIKLVNLMGLRNTMLHTAQNIRVHEVLSGTRVPTLLIAGRFEKVFTPFIRMAEELIPNIEVLLADGGHAVNIDAADQFNQAIRRLVTGHQGKPS